MIETRTAPLDAHGTGNVYQIAEHVFRDADTGELFVTDGQNTLAVRVTPEPAPQAVTL